MDERITLSTHQVVHVIKDNLLLVSPMLIIVYDSYKLTWAMCTFLLRNKVKVGLWGKFGEPGPKFTCFVVGNRQPGHTKDETLAMFALGPEGLGFLSLSRTWSSSGMFVCWLVCFLFFSFSFQSRSWHTFHGEKVIKCRHGSMLT